MEAPGTGLAESEVRLVRVGQSRYFFDNLVLFALQG